MLDQSQTTRARVASQLNKVYEVKNKGDPTPECSDSLKIDSSTPKKQYPSSPEKPIFPPRQNSSWEETLLKRYNVFKWLKKWNLYSQDPRKNIEEFVGYVIKTLLHEENEEDSSPLRRKKVNLKSLSDPSTHKTIAEKTKVGKTENDERDENNVNKDKLTATLQKSQNAFCDQISRYEGELNKLSSSLVEEKRRYEEVNRRYEEVNRRYEEVNRKCEEVHPRYEEAKRLVEESRRTCTEKDEKIKELENTLRTYEKNESTVKIEEIERGYVIVGEPSELKMVPPKEEQLNDERAKPQPIPQQEFDFVINITGFPSLSSDGWHFEKSKVSLAIESKKSCLISFMGLSKTGRSFLIEQLINAPIQQPTTNGLSIKSMIHYDVVQFLEPSGIDDPAAFGAFDQNNLDEEALRFFENQKPGMLLQMIIQNFVFTTSFTIVFVVNHLQAIEKRLILLLARRFPEKRLIIVNNFYDVTECAQVEELINHQIVGQFPIQAKIADEDKLLFTMIRNADDRNPVVHIVVAKHGSQAGSFYNPRALNYLKQVILSDGRFERMNLVERFKDHMKLLTKRFCEEPLPDLEKFVVKEDRLALVDSTPITAKDIVEDELYGVLLTANLLRKKETAYVLKEFDDRFECEVEVSSKFSQWRAKINIEKSHYYLTVHAERAPEVSSPETITIDTHPIQNIIDLSIKLSRLDSNNRLRIMKPLNWDDGILKLVIRKEPLNSDES